MEIYKEALELSIKLNFNVKIQKHKKKKNEIFYDNNYGPVEIQGKKFSNFSSIKNYLKSIVNNTKNGSEIN